MAEETVSKNFIKIWQREFIQRSAQDSRQSRMDTFISDMQSPFF